MSKIEKQIDKWFAHNHMDYSSDEMCIAAEFCANDLGHDEWLDDPDHPVWEFALQWLGGED